MAKGAALTPARRRRHRGDSVRWSPALQLHGALLAVMVACAGQAEETVAPVPLDPVQVETDEARVGAAVLQREDVPAGWQEEEEGESSAGEEIPEPAACESLAGATERGRTATGESATFAHETAQASNSVAFYADAATAREAYAAHLTDDAIRCLEEAIAEGAEQEIRNDPDIPPGAVEVTTDAGELSVEPVGDERAAWSVAVEVRVGPVTLPVFADAVVVVVDRVVIEFMFISFLGGIDEARAHILEAGVERARTALST